MEVRLGVQAVYFIISPVASLALRKPFGGYNRMQHAMLDDHPTNSLDIKSVVIDQIRDNST